jgi:thiol:disulfide interchange protein
MKPSSLLQSLFALLLAGVVAAQDPIPVAPKEKPAPIRVAAPQPQKPKIADKPVYDEAADARKDVAAAVAKAKKENRRVLIQWGANWCGWCKWLAGTMRTNGALARELMYEYDVVHVDVGRFDKNMDLAKELGADFKAIPFLTILDADGKALVQQNTEPFETKDESGKGGHDAKKLLAFFTEHQTKPLDAKVVREAAFAQAKAANKRVFLHYGAPWCVWCRRLEEWLARPEIAALLATDFVEVKIDQDRMTGGKEMLAADMASAKVKASGIPWFAFFDADGKILVTSTNENGANTGFPHAKEEVEWFGVMLTKARVHLTPNDQHTLLESLHAIRIADEAKQAAKSDGR